MPLVTVQGAHSTVVTLTYDSSANALLAQYIAAAITSGVNSGPPSIIPEDSAHSITPIGIPGPNTTEWVQDTPTGQIALPTGMDAFIGAAPFNVLANTDPNQNFLIGAASGQILALGGAGNIVAGGGNDQVILRPSDTGSWQILMGNGNDTIKALGSGNDTIGLGTGNDSVQLGGGSNAVTTGGAATISASTGSETVTGLGSTVIYGNASTLHFVATGGATVFGGTGSDTVTGGSGPDYLQGGTAGNNVLTAGVGAATLLGGGSGDQLFASGSGAQILYAGSGNETLTGSSVSGAPDTFVGSAGATTVMGAQASSLFEFIGGSAGGTMSVFGYGSGDAPNIKIHLGGGDTLQTQNNTGGNLNVTLSDGTKITFANVTGSLNGGNFV